MVSKYKLSEGSLQTIMNGGDVKEPIMQVLGSKKLNSNCQERYRILLSDGRHTISFALLSTQLGAEATEMFSVIKLMRYITNMVDIAGKRDTRIVLIMDLELVARGCEVGESIGNPVPFSGTDISNTPLNQTVTVVSSSPTLKGGASPISSLNPFHNDWMIKARVVNKSNIRHWSNANGSGKLFTVVLLDNSAEIRCTIFKDLVDKFYDLIQIDHVYNISKGLLKPANKQFSSADSFYEMTLTDDSVVEENFRDNGVVRQINYNFTSIDKIAVMEVGTIVDVIGVCKSASELQQFVSKSTKRELKKKDITLVDQSETAITVTLWDLQAESFDDTDAPVILLKGTKISEFAGTKTLTIVINTLMKINPDLVESHRLRAWYDIGGHQIDFRNVSVRDGSLNFTAPWMTFKEAQGQELPERGCYFQTCATVLVVRADRAVYQACPLGDCQKKVIDLNNGMYRCDKCNKEYDTFKYRFLLMMNLADFSSSQWVTTFSSEAEKILGKTAAEIGELMGRDPDAVTKVFEEVQFQEFVFKCRIKMENFNDEERAKTVVINVGPVNYDDYNAYLLEKIETNVDVLQDE